ncbi:MAG: hypothetical protein JWR02_378 [Mucilaginibacter sp.]|nr:hypothetical protein [Mucilaginibacter sp.]
MIVKKGERQKVKGERFFNLLTIGLILTFALLPFAFILSPFIRKFAA